MKKLPFALLGLCTATQAIVFVVSPSLTAVQAVRLNSLAVTISMLILLTNAFFTMTEVERHGKALKWFARHIKRDDAITPDPVPAELLAMVDAEDKEVP